MKLDRYYIRARLFPALLTAIPAIILYYFLVGTEMAEVVNYVIALPIILHITIGAALVYAFTLLNRFLGKEIFQRFYFKDEKLMPSTNFLLTSNMVLSIDMKEKIKQKIQNDFGIHLLSFREEANNTDEARKQIIFAVSQIKNKTRGNSLLLQHNYEYGFIRNFLGGSIFSLFNCIANVLVFYLIIPSQFACNISIGIGVVYLLFILISKWLIHRHGQMYAKVLFEQYLQS